MVKLKVFISWSLWIFGSVNNKEVYSRKLLSLREKSHNSGEYLQRTSKQTTKLAELKIRWKRRLEVKRPALPVVNRRRPEVRRQP
jgi:hypothetical protein